MGRFFYVTIGWEPLQGAGNWVLGARVYTLAYNQSIL